MTARRAWTRLMIVPALLLALAGLTLASLSVAAPALVFCTPAQPSTMP